MSKEKYKIILTYYYEQYQKTGDIKYKEHFESQSGLSIDDKRSISRFLKTFHLRHKPNIIIKKESDKKTIINGE